MQPVVKDLQRFLTDEETKFHRKLKIQKQATQYILRKAITKLLLSQYSKLAPDKVKIFVTSFGKPSLMLSENIPKLEYNVSHSGEWLLLIFSAEQSVGVDVEVLKNDFPAIDIATRFFTCGESRALMECGEPQLVQSFFKIWVRKEAYLKAVGKGLYEPLNSFEVPMASLQSSVLRAGAAHEFIGDIEGKWFFYDLRIDSQHVGCFVSGFRPHNIKVIDLLFPEQLNIPYRTSLGQ
ncbi:MAG: 4'-phosphopantetheinyl transferase superfamily protein [Desulfomonilaceae bacterium]